MQRLRISKIKNPLSGNVSFRTAVVIVAVLVGLVWLFLGRGTVRHGHGWVADQLRYDGRRYVVVKVVDGDTFDINIPDPASGEDTTRIRLWGVDTPETKAAGIPVMHFGPEATEFTREAVLDKEVLVRLAPQVSNRGKYGRLLAYVYLPDGKMLNEELLRQGYGYADERFGHIYYDRFVALSKQAQREKCGLWRDVRSEQWPVWYRKRHDPDYRDGD